MIYFMQKQNEPVIEYVSFKETRTEMQNLDKRWG